MWRESVAEPSIADPSFARRHWFWILIGTATVLAGVFFYYSSHLPDTWLFYLKVVSFSVTALLGIVGVVADFKDENKKLTTAGKLNLAGLIFAAIIGVVTQRAESISTSKAAAKAKEDYRVLLEQGIRNLEPIGDTVSVSYYAEIPLSTDTDQFYQLGNKEAFITALSEHLSQKANQYRLTHAKEFRPFAIFVGDIGDEHTFPIVDGGKLTEVWFDRESEFAKGNDIARSPLFALEFFKTNPVFDDKCLSKTDHSRFDWDKSQKRTQKQTFDFIEKNFDDLMFFYKPNAALPALAETAEDSKFKLTHPSDTLLSAVDLSGAYVQLLSEHSINPKLFNLTIRVGARELKVDLKKPIGDGCYYNLYQLPEFGTRNAKTGK